MNWRLYKLLGLLLGLTGLLKNQLESLTNFVVFKVVNYGDFKCGLLVSYHVLCWLEAFRLVILILLGCKMVEMVWLTWMVCVMCWFFSGLCFWTVMIEFLLLMLYMFGYALLAWCYCIAENWICLVIVMSGLLCVLQWCWHACYELMQIYCEWSRLIEYLWIISYRPEFARWVTYYGLFG